MTPSALVAKQAEDAGLWFVAQTAPEAYLQQALRALHAAVEASRPTVAADEREAFEAWAVGERLAFPDPHIWIAFPSGDGHAMWRAFKAGRASLLVPAGVEVGDALNTLGVLAQAPSGSAVASLPSIPDAHSGDDTLPLPVRTYKLPGGRHQIDRCGQIEGPDKWAVRNSGNCLNKAGGWEWEPLSSSRDDEFLGRCRFDTAADAYSAWLARKEAA